MSLAAHRHSGVARLRPLLLAALSLLVVSGCGRPRTTPVPPTSRPPARAPDPAPTDVPPTDTSSARPDLTLQVEPAVIEKGDSALLSWESRNASDVFIEPGIGRVDPEGRIRFFPETTSRYEVTASGPGGSVTDSVTVEVVDPASGVSAVDLAADSPEAQFARQVRPVFFAFDQASLDEEALRTLESNARWLLLPENRDLQFVIEGHCDERGSEDYNLALGDRRAQAVLTFLVESGVDRGRMTAVSLGEERPFAAGGSESDYALNRRAHFVLLQTGPGATRP